MDIFKGLINKRRLASTRIFSTSFGRSLRARDSSSSQAFPDAVDEEEEERGGGGEAGFLDVGFVGFVKVLEPVGKRRRFCRVFLVVVRFVDVDVVSGIITVAYISHGDVCKSRIDVVSPGLDGDFL